MENRNHDRENDRTSLGSAEYRARLLTKLNCLIAVLEVAITKISRSMELPGANEERLSKIRNNLQNTLSICSRAKQTLEKSIETSKATPATTSPARTPTKSRMSYRDYIELSSIEEYQKFKGMSPIRAEELASADFDDLLRKLYEA
jgi:hypothetical protein